MIKQKITVAVISTRKRCIFLQLNGFVRNFSILSKGNGVYGALGQGDSLRDSNCFKEILHGGVTMFSAGWGHSAAVTETGKLLVFGRPYDFSNLMQLNRLSKVSKTFAQFVSRSTNSRLFGSTLGYYPNPVELEGIENVQSVSCSAGLTLARTVCGKLYGFGLNRWRQCGVPFEEEDMMHVYEPTRIPGLPPCIDSDTGLQHCIALTTEGSVYTWGKANRGQLGRGPIDEMYALCGKVVLMDIDLVESPLIASRVCCGFNHGAAVGVDGAVFVWGKGFSDTPKVGTTTRLFEDQFYPRRIELPDGRRAVDIISSNFNIIIVGDDRSLWAMGMGEHDRNMNSIPLRVQTDFHTEEGHRRLVDLGSADEVDTVYMRLPEDSFLRKGYNRVTLILPSERRTIDGATLSVSSSTICASYEVVIHRDEAYILQLAIESFSFVNPKQRPQDFIIRDYSGGWQHSLLSLQSKSDMTVCSSFA